MNKIPVLFKKNEDCCGCGACLNICPRQAIKMQEDEYGFLFPVIDDEKCIRCGRCTNVCAFQNRKETNEPIECYAAISRNVEQGSKSASAGIFASFAEKVIYDGGIVFGAAFTENWGVHHVSIDNLQDLIKLQGSKYAHSNIERTYNEAKKELQTGRQVLFSGTPCQIGGLYEFLGSDYENLITVDIVCHGVPSVRMLQDYIKTFENKYGGKITAFTFRDKSIGWGINGSAVINGKKIKIWQSASSYLYYFTRGWLYRENCYKCPYACKNRPADITLGDYWGIEKQHPELLGKGGWDERAGISCMIINTKKGISFISDKELQLHKSTFEKISAGNGQLREPSNPGKRNEILQQYKCGGWIQLSKRFNSSIGWRRYLGPVKAMIPPKIKRLMKQQM